MDYKEIRRKNLERRVKIFYLDEKTANKNRTTTKYSEDSVLRREIHSYIRSLIGKNKEEALKALYARFKDEKYEKYYKYFESWVEREIVGIER